MHCVATYNINGWLLYTHGANQFSAPKPKQLNTLKVSTKSCTFTQQRWKSVDRHIAFLKKDFSDINVTLTTKSGQQADIFTPQSNKK